MGTELSYRWHSLVELGTFSKHLHAHTLVCAHDRGGAWAPESDDALTYMADLEFEPGVSDSPHGAVATQQ